MSVKNFGKKILLVDDEPQALYMMKVFLEDEGFTVFSCNNPLKIMDIINSEKVDAVISDYLMPQRNGLECIEIIRKEKGPRLPVVIVTGVHNLHLQTVKGVGGNDLVYKPIDFKKLAMIINRELSELMLVKESDFISLVLKSFLIIDAGIKIPLKVTQFSLNQFCFELPKGKCALGGLRFFEMVLTDKDNEVHFPFKGEVSELTEVDSERDLIVVDLKIYDPVGFEKIQKIYKNRQKEITDFLKQAKG